MGSRGNILLCAGGTGGHLFPAEAVAHEMVARGFEVHLAADDRVERFADRFPAKKIHRIKSATLGSKNPLAVLKTLASLWSGYRQSRQLVEHLKPVAVAGFGGYPTVPPLLAASRMHVPTLIHESNAVLGRANRLLAKKVDKVAIGFGVTKHLGGIPVEISGNPVRPAILDAAKKGYPARQANEPFNLLVFGGSQGAAFFGEVLPAACKLLAKEHQALLNVTQQARPEDRDQVREAYQLMGVKAEVETFYSDMAARMSASHLVISRAGASTVSELAVVGRPGFLIPYPHALDHDQATNAAAVASEGGAILFEQSVLTPELLADELTTAISNPKKLALAAKNAKKTGKPDATRILADMLEQLAETKQ